MTYQITFARAAQKDFTRLPAKIQNLIEKKIDGLALNPRPNGCVKLQGEEDLYRIRVGDYRVIYQVHDRILTILVVKIGNRREVYR